MKKKYTHYLPKGWTLKDVQKVAAYYDNQTEEEAAADIEAIKGGETLMEIPTKLVPQVRKLIAENGGRKVRQSRKRRVA